MATDLAFDELINRVRTQAAHGHFVDPADVCKDHPEWFDEVRRLIDTLKSNDQATRPLAVAGERFDTVAPRDTRHHDHNLPPVSSQRPAELGRLGGFRLLSELGRGGMGCVFAAEEIALKRRVALKVMRSEIAESSLAKARFLREAQAAAQLHSDYIVPIFQVGDEDGVLFIAMPLLAGQSLDQFSKEHKTAPVPLLLQIARETALGLAAAHQSGFVHRDIKPANLWLETSKNAASGHRVKILDFGLARARCITTDDQAITSTGDVMGTPGYMSPEQINGEPLDHRTDLFSLGCVLYRLATGRKPFEGNTPTAILLAAAEKEPTPPWKHRADLPDAVCEQITKLLAKKPDSRPQSAEAVAEAFLSLEKQWIEGKLTSSHRDAAAVTPDSVAVPFFAAVPCVARWRKIAAVFLYITVMIPALGWLLAPILRR